jgi:hypothetical protein
MRCLWIYLFAPIVLLTAVACEDKKAPAESARADAGASTDKYATADPKLEKALRAATSATATANNGPPPTGVFAPNAADLRHRKGTGEKVDLVGEGSDPRVLLAPGAGAGLEAARASAYGPAVLEVGMQTGPRTALPTIDLSLVFGPAKGDDASPDGLIAEVRKAAPAKEQLGQLPQEAAHEIASLAGTQLVVKMSADGGPSDAHVRFGKNPPGELERIVLRNAVEALAFSVVPFPSKPVGAGAQWIAETRMPWSGVDVIVYRAYRLKSIQDDRLTLSLDVKAYAASNDTQIPGVPKGATLEQFDAQAQGEVQLVRGEALARKFDMQQRIAMVFQAPDAEKSAPPSGLPEGKMVTAQLQGQAAMIRGGDLRAGLPRGK